MVAGFSFFAATPALADDDCTASNTVDASTGSAYEIQNLLDDSVDVVCLSGDFVLSGALQVSAPVTFKGVGTGATLDGNGTTRIIEAIRQEVTGLSLVNLNVVGGRDGAVYSNGAVTVLDTLFSGNRGDYGAAIEARGMIIASSSTFRGNTATETGGAIWGYGGATIDSSTFEDNSSDSGASAVDLSGSGSIVNSTFVGNRGPAAVDMSGGDVSLSTFLDNTMSVRTRSEAVFRGNIFASRSSSTAQIASAPDIQVGDQGGNVFSTTASSEVAMTAPDPSTLFGQSVADIFATGELADNGGRTQTVALNPLGPAIGAVVTGVPPVDQRGERRTLPADAGAYEYIETEPVPVPIPAADPVTPTLAETGVDSTPFLATGAALFAAAGSLLLFGRHQTRRIAKGR